MSMLIVLVGLLVFGPGTQPPETLKVYVFTKTDDSGFVDDKSKRLTDSVADVKKSIARTAGPFDVTLAEIPETADITIEIVGSGVEKTGTTTSTSTALLGRVNTKTSDDKRMIVRGVLRVGSYETTISSERHEVATWRAAAGYFQREFASWVKANHAKLRELLKQRQ